MELFICGTKVQLDIQNSPTQGLSFLFVHQLNAKNLVNTKKKIKINKCSNKISL